MTKSLLKAIRTGAAGLTLVAVSATAGASTIFEDNFDANDFHSRWTVTAGGVDVGAYGDLCNNSIAGGTYQGTCIDTEGTGAGTNATFNNTSAFDLVAGDYQFSFDWANNIGFGNPAGDNILNWSIAADQGLLADGSINSGAVADWTYETLSATFSVLAPVTNTTITFSQVGVDDNWGGTILDNVKLDLTNAYAVPSPAGAALLLTGLAFIGLGRVKRS